MKVKLTPAFIANELHCPEGKGRIEFVDSEGQDAVPGLFLECRATSPGEATWWLRFRPRGSRSTAYHRLGNSRDVGLADARKAARKLRAEIALGRNPRAEEQARRSAPSMNQYFDFHYWPHIENRKRSAKRDKELWKRCAERVGHLRLNEVTRQQVQTFHTDLRAEGLAAATCDHHIKLIRQMLNLAVEWNMLERNPVSRPRLFNENNKIEHLMNDQQLSKLILVLRTDLNRTVCNVCLLLLSSGARLGEALSATWDQFDLENRVWRIPAKNTKARRTRAVPINKAAFEVLNQIDTKGHFSHLFVNKRRSIDSEAPLKEVRKVWCRLRLKAGLPHLRIHDLRHAFASFLVSSGRTLYETQAILGHSSPVVTMRYAHLSTKALQDASNAASVAILGEREKDERERPLDAEGDAAVEPEAA